MTLTDYYSFAKLPDQPSKYRRDCIASTKSYPYLEAMRNKHDALFVYVSDVPEQFTAKAQRKADKVITKTKSISSLFVPDISKPIGYGDVKDTQDAVIFSVNSEYSEIEMFIARGQRNNRLALYQLFAEGELKEEACELRKSAKKEFQTKNQII